MLIIKLMVSRIKVILRTKEFYFYVIGFPLVFLLLFTFFQPISTVETKTLTIGVVDHDTQFTDSDLGDSYLWSATFINELEATNPLTNLTYFKVKTYDNVSTMEKDIANLKISGGLVIPEDFSRQITTYLKTQSYLVIMTKLTVYLQDNPSETTRLGPIIEELSRNATTSNITIQLEYHGDAAFASTHEGYTRVWQVLPLFLEKALSQQLPKTWKRLQQSFNLSNITLSFTQNATRTTQSMSFEVNLIQTGTRDVLQNVQREYFARLVPGQIMQSVLMLSTGVVVFIGDERDRGILKRLKLSRMKTTEYLVGNFLAWGIVALIQTAFFIAVATALGTVPLEFRPIELILMVVTIFLAGLLSASIAYIVGAYINYRAAIPLLSLVLITASFFSFEYFVTVQDYFFEILGRPITILDVAPWRASFLVVKKGLMLPHLFTWPDLLVDMGLTILWTAIFLVAAVHVFSKKVFRYQDE